MLRILLPRLWAHWVPRTGLAILIAAMTAMAPALARAEEPELSSKQRLEQRAQVRHLKRIAVLQMQERARSKIAAAHREAVRIERQAPWWKKTLRVVRGGSIARYHDEGIERRAPVDQVPARVAEPLESELVLSAQPNVRANNTAGDAANAGQAEEAVAIVGGRVLVAWNDGQGFVGGNPYPDLIGYATSSDSGKTFTDGGRPPKPAAFPSWKWTSDPTVAVNPKTGKFYLAGMAKSDATHNAIGIVAGSFGGGGTFTWDTVRVIRNVLDTDFLLDKPWIAADSSANYVFVAMTTFDATTPANWIDFQRSVDGGRNWTAPITISDFETDGLVQGARPVVGPNGALYAAWQAIGDTIEFDYYKVAKSLDRGATFQFEVTAVAYLGNFGTGPPGYNRERGIHYPSIAVDATRGLDRGRLWLTWNESFNHLNDVFGLTAKSEVEPNGMVANATLFTAGDILRGNSSSTSDVDYMKCTLSAGQSLVIWADSLVDNATYTVRLFAPAPDTLQRLAYSGDLTSDPGEPPRESYLVFTAPRAGTYTIQMMPLNGSSVTGNWRIRTVIGQKGSERGRDMRDVFVSTSTDGDTWSTPTRVNDDLDRYDNSLPEITVAPDGYPWVMWRDHRTDNYGSRTNQYISRSTNQGATWEMNIKLSEVIGNFSAAQSNIVPNQGDYNALSGDSLAIFGAWADGRGTSADVWTQRLETQFTINKCPSDTTITAGSEVWVQWAWIRDLNLPFGNTYEYTMSSQRNWPLPSGQITIPRDRDTGTLRPLFYVPDTAKAGKNRVCLNLRNLKRTKNIYCCTNITVIQGGLAVEDGRAPEFALGPASPNPALRMTRITYSLPFASGVRLRVHDLQGRVIRTLIESVEGPGDHGVNWDGTDDDGRTVAAGAYFYRIESAGRAISKRLVWIR